MWVVLAKMFVTKVLSSEETRKIVIDELRELAKKTTSPIDDAAVDALEQAWGHLIAPSFTAEA